MKILIITEANEKVASGHLMESIALYKKLVANNIEALILRNHDIPCLWGKKLESIDNATYSFSLYQGMEEIDVSSESCEKDDRFTFSRHFVMDPCSVNISEGHVLWIFT